MYFIFRCDCGRALYAKEGVATRKCVCGKTIKVKSDRFDMKPDVQPIPSEQFAPIPINTSNEE